MKTMKKLQIAAAVAGLFAAATAAYAGSISQSGVTIAREVVSRDPAVSQSLRAPTVTFSYQNGPTANANSSQDFNITLELGGDGTPNWSSTQVPTYKSISAVRANNGNTLVSVGPSGFVTAANTAGIELLGVEFPSANTIRYRFRLVNNNPTSVSLGDLQMQFNSVNPGNGTAPFNAVVPAPAPAATDYALVTTIAASANATTLTPGPGVTGSVIDGCGEERRRITIRSRNFIGSGVGVEGETAGVVVINNGYIVFETALDVRIDRTYAGSNTTPYTGNLNLPERATDPALNNAQFTAVPSVFGTALVMPIGAIRFRNVPNLDAWDTDINISYYKYRAQGTAPVDGDLSHPVPLNTDGDVDVGSLRVKIDSTAGFAPNSTFFLSNNPFCVTSGANLSSTSGTQVTSNTVNGVPLTNTVTFDHAQLVSVTTLGAAGTLSSTTGLATAGVGTGTPPTGYVASTNRYYLCYSVTGAAADQIPQSQFTGQATLIKQTGANEQGNESCVNPLAGLGGGVKIDVRNFFPYNPGNVNNQWVGVIRVINNSETQNADVYGQYIRADGKYGKWGQLTPANTPLAPRESRYYTSKEIFDLLANNSTTGSPVDNTGSGGLTAPTGQALPPNTRLRISSNTSSTLRVQSYIYNSITQSLVEVSNAQGADFVNVETFNNNSGVDSQDAQTGIKR
jgi:hypothetical protein